MAEATILLVDDDPDIRRLVTIYLHNEGYQVLEAADGLEALDLLQQQEVHLIILDLMMPHLDGIQACLKIREARQVPIMMLSAKGEDLDKILGLSVGADDYVTKPFHPLELVARVKAHLRRYLRFTPPPASEAEITVGELVINSATHEVRVNEQPVLLTPREFAILELLARHPGIVFSTEQIYERVWKDSFWQADNTVMVHIRHLREKIEANPRQPRYIKTVWGVGYKLEKI